MAISDLSNPASIIKAISLYDKLGRKAFLDKYGFGKARKYYLIYNGKRYDSKAIIGVAYQFEVPNQGPLGSRDFSGGKHTVMPKLKELGFIVRRIND